VSNCLDGGKAFSDKFFNDFAIMVSATGLKLII
jgi:hypothetical protein